MKSNKQVAISFVAGKSANSGNLHTDGRHITSYSTIIGEDYGRVVLLDSYRYSSTTDRHKMEIYHATYGTGKRIIEVPSVVNLNYWVEDHKKNIAYLNNQVDMWKGKAKRARKYGNIYEANAAVCEEDIKAYKAAFNLSK